MSVKVSSWPTSIVCILCTEVWNWPITDLVAPPIAEFLPSCMLKFTITGITEPWRSGFPKYSARNHVKSQSTSTRAPSSYFFFHFCDSCPSVLCQWLDDLLLDNNRITCNHSDCLLSANSFQTFLSSNFSVNLKHFSASGWITLNAYALAVYFSMTIGLRVITL